MKFKSIIFILIIFANYIVGCPDVQIIKDSASGIASNGEDCRVQNTNVGNTVNVRIKEKEQKLDADIIKELIAKLLSTEKLHDAYNEGDRKSALCNFIAPKRVDYNSDLKVLQDKYNQKFKTLKQHGDQLDFIYNLMNKLVEIVNRNDELERSIIKSLHHVNTSQGG